MKISRLVRKVRIHFALMCSTAIATCFGVAQADDHESLPAVSEINGKIAAGGGVLDNDGLYLLEGSLAVPVSHSFGVQLDGLIGTVDGDGVGGAGAHVFWRDPSVGIFGLYGSGVVNTADVNYTLGNVGAAGSLYFGQFSVDAVAGAQFSDVRDTEVFGSFGGSFYPVDDLRLYAAYRHWFGRNEGAFGLEWQVPGQNDDSLNFALFADGRVRNGDDYALAGVRVYFGSQKSLIRRHREDDPASILQADLFTIENMIQGGGGVAAPPPPGEDGVCPEGTIPTEDGLCVEIIDGIGGTFIDDISFTFEQ
jgi:hypothetical protein